MARKPSKPSFFWQGVLILLPVFLLALGSLASMRWDEQSAERDARQRASQSVQSLADVIRYSTKEELQRFTGLQNKWMTERFGGNWPSVAWTPDRRLSADIAKWEQEYPGLKLAELATPEAEIMEDGREIDPPDTPVAPVPPKWFRELSPDQQNLWQTLRREKPGDNADYRAAYNAFTQSDVSDAARQAAAFLEQWLRYHRFYNEAAPDDSEYSESGISFQGIALAQALRDPTTQLSNSVQEAFWSEITRSPSFIAPMLLEMAEARTNGADAATCEKVRWTRQLWEIQSKEREWLAPLRHAPELTNGWRPPAFWSRWTSGSAGEALAFGEPETFLNGPAPGKGHGIWFVPREVIEAIFTKALVKNRFLVPDFAEVALTVEGKTLVAPSRNGVLELLGTADGTTGSLRIPDAAKFEVKFFLTSREQMLSAERHRARLFGLLILGAVAAALIGFVSARRAFHKQLQLSEAKSNFVSSVSHELRAPIASVRLMAESLERGKISEAPKQNEYFRFIVQECRRLTSLIENVLDFSRIEQGRKQYEFEPTDLPTLVHETVKLMEPYATEKGVRLETHPGSAGVPPASPNEQEVPNAGGTEANPNARKSYIVNRKSSDHSALRTPNSELNLDGRALQQALVNLIDNAIKHSPKGSLVKIDFEWNSDWVRLWVEDEGPGIPPEEHEKIFERFYRLGSELRRETQGVGIGLSIVKHIAEAHGGHVTVRSGVGQGSRFTIELPANPQSCKDSNEQ